MEISKRITPIHKFGRPIDWTQHNQVRLTSIEEAMEFEYGLEPVKRYVDNVKVVQPRPRKRTFSRLMGREARAEKRGLQ